jgi:ATP phosphoribosyltransferase regulatory subunit
MALERSSAALQRTHLPHGVADYFWTEARERRLLEARLLELFRSWGYGDVIPPMFEYAETYHARAGSELESEVYRFLDRDGSTLALRADMTIPVARLVATRLHDCAMPQRFCYAGSVFRYTEPQAGLQREFAQAGIELIGSRSPQADAEVMALTARALQAAAISQFKLVVGQMQFFDGLLEALNLAPDRSRALQRAIDRNSHADLLEFLRTVSLPEAHRRAVEEMPLLSGPEVDAVINRAEKVCLNAGMHNALNNLRAVADNLDAYGEAGRLYVDLTEIHNLGYYTGITFEALTPELGFAVAGGGRYDNLVASFGADQPAVGAALTSERLLLARRRTEPARSATHPASPDVLFGIAPEAVSLKSIMPIVQDWRSRRLSVAIDVDGLVDDALLEFGRVTGAQYCIRWTDEGAVVTAMNQTASASRFVPASQMDQLATEILNAISSAD